MRTYVPQRQIFPPMLCSIWESVGLETILKSATAVMIWPLWQYPHWTTSVETQASWTARPTRSVPIASIVTIGREPTTDTGSTHERVGTPPTCTVQAPHAAMPQPYLVPVIFKPSRSTQRSGVPGSAVTSVGRPFIVSVYVAM